MGDDLEADDLLARAVDGDPWAVTCLWKILYPKVRQAVASRIASLPQLAGDTSDIASESLQAFFRKIEEGGLPELAEVNSLWGLLRAIAIRRVNDRRKWWNAAKRGGGAVMLSFREEDQPQLGESQLMVEFQDLVDRLLDSLPNEESRGIVGLRLRGASVTDIAELMGMSVRSVQRRMRVIETIWERVSNDGRSSVA